MAVFKVLLFALFLLEIIILLNVTNNKLTQAVNVSSTHLRKVYGYDFILNDSIRKDLMARWPPTHK